MNQVVNFLSFLSVTEEQGGIKRMHAVCAEFERIARVVLEKNEKGAHSRRKRKSSKGPEEQAPPTPQYTALKRPAPQTPVSNQDSTPSNTSPSFNGDLNNQAFNPSLNNAFSPQMPDNDVPLPLDFNSPSGDFGNLLTPSNGLTPGFQGDNTQYHSEDSSSLDVGSFQQPFLPQDLWQMPMTLEWDWADMTNTGFLNIDGQPDDEQQSLNPGQSQM